MAGLNWESVSLSAVSAITRRSSPVSRFSAKPLGPASGSNECSSRSYREEETQANSNQWRTDRLDQSIRNTRTCEPAAGLSQTSCRRPNQCGTTGPNESSWSSGHHPTDRASQREDRDGGNRICRDRPGRERPAGSSDAESLWGGRYGEGRTDRNSGRPTRDRRPHLDRSRISSRLCRRVARSRYPIPPTIS